MPSIQSYKFLEGGGETGALIRNYDWSATAIGAVENWPAALLSAVSNMLRTSLPMLVLWGRDATCFYNDAYRPSLSPQKHPSIGEPSREVWPERWDFIGPLIEKVRATGEPVTFNDQPLKSYRNGIAEDVFWTFCYSAILENDGNIGGILVTCIETTESVSARKKLEESETINRKMLEVSRSNEAKLRTILNSAPTAIGVFSGPDLIVENPNQLLIEVMGLGPDLEGKSFRKILADVVEEDQKFIQIIDSVRSTGQPFEANEVQVLFNAGSTIRFFNITFMPLIDESGTVYAVLDISVDVTVQVLSRQKIEEQEAILRNSLEIAKLGTWNMNLVTGMIHCSPRFAEMIGVDQEDVSIENITDRIHNHDKAVFTRSIKAAQTAVTDTRYEAEYTIINKRTGRTHIIHNLGQIYFDESGNPLRISGTAQDVTAQRDLETILKTQVQTRTSELDASNQKLASANEELALSNRQLTRSNDELAQYAYVASHDLQEPLRKIRVFSNMLESDTELPAKAIKVIGKINSASERMSHLIDDLLNFSQLTRAELAFVPVDLNQIAKDVLVDFDLVIQEKKAIVELGTLPVIDAVKLQMNQLFYNLVSNSLKFTRNDAQPVVTISSEIADSNHLLKYITHPIESVVYYIITIKDNGIGFEKNYSERIFEVFQRLHTRESYPGSGIGLALCRKIVTNHNGVIYTNSVSGEGTSFTFILPATQSPLTKSAASGNQ